MIHNLQWIYFLAVNFFSISASNVVAIMLLSLCSRLASMFALLLPLKILLLVGNDRIPKYMPEIFQALSFDFLISFLCIATVFLYLVHLLLEKVINRIESKAEKIVISQLFLPELSPHESKLMVRAYTRIMIGLSESFFIAIVFLIMMIIYPALAVFLLAYAVVILSFYENVLKKDQLSEENDDLKKNDLVGLWVDVGFLFSFFFIVVSMLVDVAPSVMMAFICFLLLRRSTGSIKRLIRNLSYLFTHKEKLSKNLLGKAKDEPIKVDVVKPRENIELELISILESEYPNESVEIISNRKFIQKNQLPLVYLVTARVAGAEDLFMVKFFSKKQQAESELELYLTALNGFCVDIRMGGDTPTWLLIQCSSNTVDEF